MVYWLGQIARKHEVSIADSSDACIGYENRCPWENLYVRARFDGIRYSKRKQHFSSLKE